MPEENNLVDVHTIANATGGSQNKNSAYLAFKFAFTPSRGEVGGAFCQVFEAKSGKVVFQAFWLARPYSGKGLPDPSKEWRSFVKKFPQMGPLDKTTGEKLQKSVNSLLHDDDRKRLFENYTKPRLRQLESQIRRMIEEDTGCVFSAMCDAEELDRNALERAKVLKPVKTLAEEAEKARQAMEKQEQKQEETSAKMQIIKCTPVIDPVRGKASSSIVPGDILEVVLEGEGAGAIIKKYLEDNNLASIFPVEKVEKQNDRAYIYLRINNEIQGLMTITKDLMLRTKYSDEPVKPKSGRNFFEDIFFFAILGGALAGLLFFIRYLFL